MSATPSSPIHLVLAFDHPLNAVESVADALAAGLAALGQAPRVLSLPRDLSALASLKPQDVARVYSLGSVPLTFKIGNQWLWQHFACPVSAYLLDAPIYDIGRVPAFNRFIVDARLDRRLSLCAPETGYRDWLGAALDVTWHHVPFAPFAAPDAAMPTAQDVQPRVCVIGTVGSELGGQCNLPLAEALRAWFGAEMPPGGPDDLAAALLAPEADPLPARQLSQAMRWAPQECLQPQRLKGLLALDSWVKRHRRLLAVRSLGQVPVDFFGTGWQGLLGTQAHHRHVGQVAHQDIARLMPHYQAVLNFDPNWQGGVHDRVYTAAAMGVPVITNEAAPLAALQQQGAALLSYACNGPSLEERLQDWPAWTAASGPRQPDFGFMASHNWANRMAVWQAA